MNYEKEMKELFYMQQVYATLFSVSNKIQTVGDKVYENLSSRQYMTILGILHLPEDKRNLNNIAKKIGTTKQNIRQIINVLEKKNYIEINKSENDKRSINVKVTELGIQEAINFSVPGIMFMADIFKDFSENELKILWNLLKKLYSFDGEAQDGFEDNVSLESGVSEEENEMILKIFSQKRKESRS